MNENALYSSQYKVTSFLINPFGELSLYGLLNLLQEAASDHAALIGFGDEEMIRQKTFWVLTRQKLVMKKWPKYGDTVSIKTWVRLGESAFSNRDFIVTLNGERIGECSTSWITLHAETRKPLILDHSELLKKLKTTETVQIDPVKIALERENLITLNSFSVRNSDLDANMHVNNTKYSQWIFDSLPLFSLNREGFSTYEVNFLQETKLNDQINIQQATSNEDYFHGFRDSDQKIVFSVKIKKGPV